MQRRRDRLTWEEGGGWRLREKERVCVKVAIVPRGPAVEGHVFDVNYKTVPRLWRRPHPLQPPPRRASNPAQSRRGVRAPSHLLAGNLLARVAY